MTGRPLSRPVRPPPGVEGMTGTLIFIGLRVYTLKEEEEGGKEEVDLKDTHL